MYLYTFPYLGSVVYVTGNRYVRLEVSDDLFDACCLLLTGFCFLMLLLLLVVGYLTFGYIGYFGYLTFGYGYGNSNSKIFAFRVGNESP